MKKLNKIIYVLLFVIAISLSGAFATIPINQGATSVSLINQNPNPVYAGNVGEATLAIANMGSGTIDGSTFQVLNQYPFTVISPGVINPGTIFSGSGYAFNQKVKFKVNSSATAGNYNMIIRETTKTGLTRDYNVSIAVAANKNVEIESISKNSINPGGIETVSVKVKNVGSSDLSDVIFSWSNPDNVLLPVNGDNKVYINSLKVGEVKIINFTMSASSAATISLYKVNMNFSYQDTQTGTTTQEVSTTGIYVGGKTNFNVLYDSTSSGEDVFTIANVGANDATSVQIGLDPKSGWKTSGPTENLVGNLNRGDYTTFSFTFTRPIGNLIFDISYTDTSGNRVNLTKTVSMNSQATLLSGNFSGRGQYANTNSASGKSSSFQRRGSPLGGISSGMSSIGSGLKYVGYFVLILILAYFGRMYYVRKKKNSKIQK